MKTSWGTADSFYCLSWLCRVSVAPYMMQDLTQCILLHYWWGLNVDWPQVSWTYPKPQCWLWAVEDWAAHWHCTLQLQALVGSCLDTFHDNVSMCFICKLFLEKLIKINTENVLFNVTAVLFFISRGEEGLQTAPFNMEVTCLDIWCLLKKHIYNVAGRLGLLDYDEVELNNLHRQVLHGEENQGQAKALSAAHSVRRYQLALVAFINI